ncbi:MAG: hypothetical protein NWT02_06315 [Opitutales bacterium]|jgi:hypothetical protein|nr:hypothetical protein [Opitutales bacterium]MDP4643627.1 hypothetical protein [Opitutales bacterium]MDP4776823.1 hypothetical protein [Opitutales bacterium]MDP4884560.1 hypothetical protein [Opitutales bacterium]MDP5079590.1 hypothetical protein [Opitutales bacterium]
MNSKPLIYIALFCILGTCGYSAEPKIKLSGRKDIVLKADERSTVLDAADRYLGQKDATFIGQVNDYVNPYAFKQAPAAKVVVAVENVTSDEPEVVAATVVYDDASVLKVIASNFSKQVRGTLARGSTNYIQLQGGNLLKPGTKFPARIAEDSDTQYNVILTEITSENYTLSLGDATLTLSYDEGKKGSTGAVRYEN